MDVLSSVLSKLKLSSVIYFKSDFSSPWGMDVPKGPFAQFHIVMRGQCEMRTNDVRLQLFAGDIIVFPHGINHWVADNERSKKTNGQTVVKSIKGGVPIFKGDRISTTLVCGHFEYDRNVDHPFLNELPEIIHISEAERNEMVWLENAISLITHEIGYDKIGSDIIVNRLGEVLFINVVRAYLQQRENESGFLAAIQDEKIGRTLQAMHNEPERDWQLSTLAQIAGMSRTGFSSRFKALVGQTAMSYITSWRILNAQELLTGSEKTVGEIAEQVGYQSEAAFNRVFKKRVSQTPLKYRKSRIS